MALALSVALVLTMHAGAFAQEIEVVLDASADMHAAIDGVERIEVAVFLAVSDPV